MPNSLPKEAFDSLIADTNFVTAELGTTRHLGQKIKTPLEVINCIFGGGIPLGAISEISGHPSGGKTTLMYQCLAEYQKTYPSGVSVILDMESSMDNERLTALGVDVSKVIRLPSTTMQNAFSNLFVMINKMKKLREKYPDISLFVIYDSISVGGTDKQHEATAEGKDAFGAGSLQESARILKQDLSALLPYTEDLPIYLGLINQVYTQLNKYGMASIKSGEVFGLKHICHSHICFGEPKKDFDGDFLMGTTSQVEIKKSRFSPQFINIPCYVDVTQGGMIDEVRSFVEYLSKKGVEIIVNSNGWYVAGDNLTNLVKKYPNLANHEKFTDFCKKKSRLSVLCNTLRENPDLYAVLKVALIEFLDNKYPAQRNVNGDYQEQLIKNCELFS